MTVETKTTIQANDIISVEFECAKCHSTTSFPMDVAKGPITRCHCHQDNWMAIGSPEYVAIEDLITRLRQFGRESNPNYIMRFGLSPSVHASGKTG